MMRPSRTGWEATVLIAVCVVAVFLAPAATVAAGGPTTLPDDAQSAAAHADGTAAVAAIQADDASFTVSSVTVEDPEIEVGEAVRVEAVVENDGDEPAPIETSLELDGEVVETRTPEIQPEFPVVVRFEAVVDEAGTYTVSVNGVEAETDLVVGESDGDEGSERDGGDGGDDTADDPAQFEVVDVRLDPSEAAPGETVRVIANVSNRGEEPGDFETELEIDGEVVDSEVVPQILPNTDVGARHTFEYEPDATGTYTVSVSGTEAESELVVEESGGGGLFGFLGVLPLGLLRPIGLFVVLPLLLIYLALKALAIYLGY